MAPDLVQGLCDRDRTRYSAVQAAAGWADQTRVGEGLVAVEAERCGSRPAVSDTLLTAEMFASLSGSDDDDVAEI